MWTRFHGRRRRECCKSYAPGRRTTRIFDDPPDVVAYPEEASLHIWDQHRFGVLDLSPSPA